MPTSVTVLTAIPASDVERLLVVLVQSPDKSSRMELRQQSFSKGIGWFTQSTVHLEPSQVAGLRNALGTRGGQGSMSHLPREFSTIAPTTWQPKLVQADSAYRGGRIDGLLIASCDRRVLLLAALRFR